MYCRLVTKERKRSTQGIVPLAVTAVFHQSESRRRRRWKRVKKKERRSLINQAKKFQVIHPPLPHPKVVQVVRNQKQIRKLLCTRKHHEAKPPVKTRKKRNIKSQFLWINLVHQMMKQRRKIQSRRRNSPVVMVVVMQQRQSKPLPYLLKNSTK